MINDPLKNGGVLCDYWETPVLDSAELWLKRQLLTTFNTYFFFHKNHDSPRNEYYTLTINSDEPFKITEERLGWKVVGDLLNNKVPSAKKQLLGQKHLKYGILSSLKNPLGPFLLQVKSMKR